MVTTLEWLWTFHEHSNMSTETNVYKQMYVTSGFYRSECDRPVSFSAKHKMSSVCCDVRAFVLKAVSSFLHSQTTRRIRNQWRLSCAHRGLDGLIKSLLGVAYHSNFSGSFTRDSDDGACTRNTHIRKDRQASIQCVPVDLGQGTSETEFQRVCNVVSTRFFLVCRIVYRRLYSVVMSEQDTVACKVQHVLERPVSDPKSLV